MKYLKLFIVALLLLGVSAQAAVFTDDAGVEFTIEAAPEKTAVLFSSFAEIYALAGGSVDITVYESVERGFAAADAYLVDDGAGKKINTELLLAAQPDFVICSMDIPAQVQAAELLNRAGIPAAQFSVESFSDYLRVLEICCEITGDTEAYARYGESRQSEIESLLAEGRETLAGGKQILFVRAGSTRDSTKAKSSSDHFAAAMLQEFGCVNIADDALPGSALSMETIIERDPEYIFFSMMGDEQAARNNIESMLESDTWSHLTAVQAGNYAILPRELFHFKPNHRWAEAYEYLYDILQEGESK